MSIQSIFNIGGLTLIITCEDEIYAPEDQIRGKVILRGGEYQQHVRSVRFRFREFWPEKTYVPGTRSRGAIAVTVYNNHKTIVLANATTIEPRFETVFDFSVQLPRNCRISESGSGWLLTVDVDIPQAVDAKVDLILDVVASEEMTTFINTIVGRLQFKEDQLLWGWNDGVTRKGLLPPMAFQSKLDYIWFEMRQVNDGLAVEAVFNLGAKSVVDYLKTFFDRNPTSWKSARRKFNLMAEQIWMRDRRPNTAEILKVFKPILQDVVKKRA